MTTPTSTPSTSPRLRLTKHHGAGNDFLVLVDLDGGRVLTAELVRALCDRRFGVGADGVIRILAGTAGADLTMDLTNADGSTAEMSGNGMRCLAQAAVTAGLVQPPAFTVATLGGVRAVEFRAGADGVDRSSVEMGPVRLGAERPPAFAEHRARLVDVGNPHLVLLVDDPTGVDVTEQGTKLQSDFPDGVNVEFIAPGRRPDTLTLRVWERGVGETNACGTGSVAAAAAAQGWGLVGRDVDVDNPGGPLGVHLGDDGALLSGPVEFVAEVEVATESLLAGRRP